MVLRDSEITFFFIIVDPSQYMVMEFYTNCINNNVCKYITLDCICKYSQQKKQLEVYRMENIQMNSDIVRLQILTNH